MSAVRVVLADNHVYTRDGMHRALTSAGFLVCAEASTLPDAVAKVRAVRPQVALVDVRLAGSSGASVVRWILHADPTVAVVAMSCAVDDEELDAALDAGACGYLLKDIDPGRLAGALHKCLRRHERRRAVADWEHRVAL